MRLGLALCFFSVGSLALYYFKGTLSLPRIRTFGREAASTALSLLAALAFLLLAADAYISRFDIFLELRWPAVRRNIHGHHARLPMPARRRQLAGGLLWFNLSPRVTGGYCDSPVSCVYHRGAHLSGDRPQVYRGAERARKSLRRSRTTLTQLYRHTACRMFRKGISGALTPADIRATVHHQSIRLWDHEPLLDTFSQIQEIHLLRLQLGG